MQMTCDEEKVRGKRERESMRTRVSGQNEISD
jgi:hypothetical protein